jgi:hypothetical protein
MIVKLLQVDGYDLFKFMLSSFSFLISFNIVQSYNDKKILNVSPQIWPRDLIHICVIILALNHINELWPNQNK